MMINGIGCNSRVCIKNEKKNNGAFDISGDAELSPVKSELEYYKNLCSEYKSVTFRLDDKKDGISNEHSLGYKGSMNQIGNNFGKSGQCSISIDVAVIRKMQSDPNYEKQIKGIIESCKKNYSKYESNALSDGFPNICVNIEDEGGKPIKSITQSPVAFSTEDEVKQLWNDKISSSKIVRRFDSMEEDLLDTFLSFVEKNKIKSEKMYEASQTKPL